MDKNKLIQTANFIEELSWLLESGKNISLKEISILIRNLSNERNIVFHNKLDFAINNEGKTYLVGVLPKILQDTELFKSNSEMLDFAEEVLLLKPSRAAKRSRIEYIGWIVCEVSNTNNENLDTLYKYLKEIFSDDVRIAKIKKAKKEVGFTWNKIIRNL
ncbi:hypothetical protein [Flavobacterium sp.]|uniref:hypothetical protein n=1 Tax=Flavobacterium sp. TaxID=239 RepID=UPI003526CFE5